MDDISWKRWYDGLFKWLETWLNTYRKHVTQAYRKLNVDLIPNRRYSRALVWCMHIFDLTVLTHQMVSMVYETENSTQSVYYLDTVDLIEILRRLENTMNQCRDTFDELTTVDAIERMHVALTEVGDGGADRVESQTRDDDPFDTSALPVGLTSYAPERDQAALVEDVLIARRDNVDPQLMEMVTSLEILRAAGDREAVRAGNMEYRLPPSGVRAITMIATPGDAALARQLCESYIAKLAKTVDGVRAYRLDFGSMLSRYRGESERNFERIMDWLVERARENAADQRHFVVLWIDDVHALMSQRGQAVAAGEDYLNVIKTTMLQKMDSFNKDSRLSRFALLFSTGNEQSDVDAAFRRRVDNIYELLPLSKSPGFLEILVRHALRSTRLNVEGAARKRLLESKTASDLQSAVAAFFVHVKFILAHEFNVVARGTERYRLSPFKTYYNIKGEPVRPVDNSGRGDDTIMQAVEPVEGGTRVFYVKDHADARNLSEADAGRTVFVLYEDPDPDKTPADTTSANLSKRPDTMSRDRRTQKRKIPVVGQRVANAQQKKYLQQFAEELRPAAGVQENLSDEGDL